MVGWEAADSARLIAQHAPKKLLDGWLPLMKNAVAKHEIRLSNLATSIDRVLAYDNKKQVYGTQSRLPDDVVKDYETENAGQVNQRR